MLKPPKIETAFTKLFNIDYPIVAAPMFLVSDGKLTAAVGNAGATGAFPALNFRPVDALRKEIRAVKAATKAPFGINIIVQESNKHRDEQIEVCLEEGVDYFISSLGNPTDLVKKARARGAKVFCDVIGEKHAKKAIDAGADGLVAVSAGAGGHAGEISAFALIPRLKEKFQVPVIAAGSIVNGRTMLAALALGADAAYLGTRFIASEESNASADYKKAIIDASMEDIVNTDRVDGFPGNFIRTSNFKQLVPDAGLAERLFRMNKKFEKTWRLYKASRSLFEKPTTLKASYKTVFSAGHGAGLIKEIRSAESIVHTIVSEYWEAKKNLP
jgi:nitronate monooxygenase